MLPCLNNNTVLPLLSHTHAHICINIYTHIIGMQKLETFYKTYYLVLLYDHSPDLMML